MGWRREFFLLPIVWGEGYFEVGRILEVNSFTVFRFRCVVFRFGALVIFPWVVKVVAVDRWLAIVAVGVVSTLLVKIAYKACRSWSPLAGHANFVAYVFRRVGGDAKIYQWEGLPFKVWFFVSPSDYVATVDAYRRT